MPKLKYTNQYFLITFFVVFFYSLYSVILDRIYFSIDHGEDKGFLSSIFYYFFQFLIIYFPFNFIIIIFYNWLIINGFGTVKKNIAKFIFGIFVGSMVGLGMHDVQGSFYIGSLRPQRNFVLFLLIGISIEIIRTLIEKRNDKQFEKFE